MKGKTFRTHDIRLECVEKVVFYIKAKCWFSLLFLLFSLGYSTNTLTGVGVGKSSLDPHSHFRQPGKDFYHFEAILNLLVELSIWDNFYER